MLRRSIGSLTERAGGEFAALEGIRFISCLCVILFHAVIVSTVFLPVERIAEFEAFVHHNVWLYSGYLFVNNFFIASGFLLTLELMRKSWSVVEIVQLFVLRVIRLVPVYIVFLLLRKLADPAACSGRQILKSILLISNYSDMGCKCAGEGWSLAVDVHSCLLLMVVYKVCQVLKINLKKAFVVLLVVAFGIRVVQWLSLDENIVLPQFATCYLIIGNSNESVLQKNAHFRKSLGDITPHISEQGLEVLKNRSKQFANYYNNFYLRSHSRFGSFIVGGLLALYYTERRTLESMVQRLAVLATGFISSLYFLWYCGYYISKETVAYNQFHVIVDHYAVSISMALIIYYILTVRQGEPFYFVKRALSFRYVVSVAKISYCIYLSQIMMIFLAAVVYQPTNNTIDLKYLLTLSGISTVLSILFGFVMYVLVEHPSLYFRSALKSIMIQTEKKCKGQ